MIKTSDSLDSLLGDVMTEFFERLSAGESPQIEQYAHDYPEVAHLIRDTFPALKMIQDAGGSGLMSSGTLVSGGIDTDEQQQLGDFRIVRELGRGGMGVVYEAEQISMGRKVALKMLPFAAMLDKQQFNRFKNEARATGTLDHPNIVNVYSVGTERGVHYYAMQLVEGQSLAEVIAGRREAGGGRQEAREKEQNVVSGGDPTAAFDSALRISQSAIETRPVAAISTQPSINTQLYFQAVAQLGIQAAEALDHAHQNGIVHRDVKPANLLVDADGKLFVTDFGLARIEADAGMTMSGDLLGTLRYMSPEQALAKRGVVDHRTDIYSLGATLYELLALEPVYSATDRQELLKQIAFEEPPKLRRLNHRIPVDLETIVAKAMEKNPDDRYAAAQELADDLGRCIRDEPIQAKPPTSLQRIIKWSRRHPTLVWAALVVLTIGLAVSMASTVLIAGALTQVRHAKGRAERERDNAQVARDEAQRERDAGYRNLYVAQMRQAHQDWRSGHVPRFIDLLIGHLPRNGREDLRGWEWYYLLGLASHQDLTYRGNERGVRALAWRPDGRHIASCDYIGQIEGDRSQIKIWDPVTGDEAHTLLAPPGSQNISDLAWSPDSDLLAGVWDNGTVGIWDVDAEQMRLEFETGIDKSQHSLSWGPDSKRLAIPGENRTVAIWDVTNGANVRTLTGHITDVRIVAWSPDGESLAATGYEPGWITIWNVATGTLHQTLKCAEQEFIYSLAWSPDSRRLVSGDSDAAARVWNVDSGEELFVLKHTQVVRSTEFSPDGQQLATATASQGIKVWNASTGQLERTVQGYDHKLNSFSWSPDGKRLVTAHLSGAKVWSIKQEPGIWSIDAKPMGGLAWSPDDKQLAIGNVNRDIIICDAQDGRKIRQLEGHDGLELASLSWSFDGTLIACAGNDGSIRVWDAVAGETIRTWQHEGASAPVASDTWRSVALSWHPSSLQLATGSEKEPTVRIWDGLSGEQVDSFEVVRSDGAQRPYVTDVLWSPDGERLATVGNDRESAYLIEIWRASDWHRLHAISTEVYHPTRVLTWSPDGRYLAAAGTTDKPIYVIDTLIGRVADSITGHMGYIQQIAWGNDSRRLLSIGEGGCYLWDTTTGRRLLQLESRGPAAWSHDGQKIATNTKGRIQIHDAAAGYALLRDPVFRRDQVDRYMNLAQYRVATHNFRDASELLNVALSMAPEDGKVQSRAAWHLSTFSDVRLRDPDRALELSLKATALSPESVMAWQVLGWARYRKGEWQAAVTSLEKSIELQQDGGDPWQWIFLAMSHWQLGHQKEARQWYHRSVAWLEKNNNTNEDAIRFRNEAAELMGIEIDALDKK